MTEWRILVSRSKDRPGIFVAQYEVNWVSGWITKDIAEDESPDNALIQLLLKLGYKGIEL